MKNKKQDMIIALKKAIKALGKKDLKITDRILVTVIQWKTKEEEYDIDFHVVN